MEHDSRGHGPARRRPGGHDLRAPHRLPADPLRDRIVELPPSWTRCSASTPRTWARSAPTGCCTPRSRLCGTDVRSLGDGVRGRRVAVVGGGVVGLLTGLFAAGHGAAEVVVLDPTPSAAPPREQLGLDASTRTPATPR